jgi:DNA-3-methyladenine glycosylase II
MSKKNFSDPIMQALHETVVRKHGSIELPQPVTPEEFFWSLCESIMGQQLSEKVAPQIIQRVKKALNNQLNPDTVLSTEDIKLREAGLSYSKISYLKNVAQAWKSGEIDPFKVSALSDEEVILKLTTIKGVGRWTAEMFLMFTLGRTDIFSAGDYGLRKAISLAYNLPMETKPTELIQLSEQWRPNRTLAAKILWKSLD